MESRSYVSPLLKWWLLVAATAVAGVLSYVIVRRQPSMYQARTTLMIGCTLFDPNPSGIEFSLG